MCAGSRQQQAAIRARCVMLPALSDARSSSQPRRTPGISASSASAKHNSRQRCMPNSQCPRAPVLPYSCSSRRWPPRQPCRRRPASWRPAAESPATSGLTRARLRRGCRRAAPRLASGGTGKKGAGRQQCVSGQGGHSASGRAHARTHACQNQQQQHAQSPAIFLSLARVRSLGMTASGVMEPDDRPDALPGEGPDRQTGRQTRVRRDDAGGDGAGDGDASSIEQLH